MRLFSRILVCTDLTTKSVRAMRTAVQLARQNGATLAALHVIGMPPSLFGSSQSDSRVYKDLLKRQKRAAEAELSREITKATGVQGDMRVRMITKTGLPADTIATVVQELDADLVIIARGAKGKLGSTAEWVVRLVGRNVLVVPSRTSRTLRADRKSPTSLTSRPRRPRAAASSR